MSDGILIAIFVAEIIFGVGIIIGFANEKKVAKFERRVLRKIKIIVRVLIESFKESKFYKFFHRKIYEIIRNMCSKWLAKKGLTVTKLVDSK